MYIIETYTIVNILFSRTELELNERVELEPNLLRLSNKIVVRTRSAKYRTSLSRLTNRSILLQP